MKENDKRIKRVVVCLTKHMGHFNSTSLHFPHFAVRGHLWCCIIRVCIKYYLSVFCYSTAN